LRKLPITRLYHITSLVFDNTSENRGNKKSIHVFFEKFRQEEWKSDQREGALVPLTIKGCGDHECALISKCFEGKVLSCWRRWGDKNLIHKRVPLPYWLITNLSRRFRTKWKQTWFHFARQEKLKKFSFRKSSRNRYISFDLNAEVIVDNHQAILKWMTLQRLLLSEEEKILFEALQNSDVFSVLFARTKRIVSISFSHVSQ